VSEPKDGRFDAEYLRSILQYDPDTGLCLWLDSIGAAKKGSIAGSCRKNGRRVIKIGSRTYQAPRLAWLYMTGEWPETTVDHEDRDPTNDRWSNLRLASKAQQAIKQGIHSHNTPGVTGVYKRFGKYCATIQSEYKQIWLGTFNTEEKAIAARKAAEEKYFGEFAPKSKQYTGKDLFSDDSRDSDSTE
jgi:hypothetical protein